MGTPTLGNGDNINTGLALSTLRILLGYDRLLIPNLTLGGRIGFAFNGASGQGVSFLPVHIEARLGIWPGHEPFVGRGVRPFFFVSGGLGEVDTKVNVKVLEDGTKCGAADPGLNSSPCTVQTPGDNNSGPEPREQTLTVYRQAGTGFVSGGFGVQFAPSARVGINLGVRASVTVPVIELRAVARARPLGGVLMSAIRSDRLAAALDRAVLAGDAAELFELLRRGSGLPGPRPNLDLARAVGHALARHEGRADRIVAELGRSDDEYQRDRRRDGARRAIAPRQAACARRAARWRPWQELAEDPRHHVRLGVVEALRTRIGARGEAAVVELAAWTDGYLQAHVALEALADRTMLATLPSGDAVLARLGEAFVAGGRVAARGGAHPRACGCSARACRRRSRPSPRASPRRSAGSRRRRRASGRRRARWWRAPSRRCGGRWSPTSRRSASRRCSRRAGSRRATRRGSSRG